MGSTALHAYPYPEGSAQPVVHLDLKASVDSVDLDTYVTCLSTSRPPHKPGRRIFETDSGHQYVSRGGAWYMVPQCVRGRISGGTDVNGVLIFAHSLGVVPAAVLFTPAFVADNNFVTSVSKHVVGGQTNATQVEMILYRTDSNVRFQQPCDFYYVLFS